MEEAHDRRQLPEEGSAPAPETWARRLQHGEPRAVQEVRRRVGGILAHGRLAIPDQERADLEQEIMTDLWKAVNRSGFDCAGGFWGFVEVVASRRCIDWLRARREQALLSEEIVSPGGGPLREMLEQERSKLAAGILSALDSRCRKLIALRLRDDLSYGEMAQILGRSEGALRTQVHRCIQEARRLVERVVESPEKREKNGGRR